MPDTYTTESGDTWDYVAYKKLGSESYANKLMETNREYINTTIFSAGVVLQLPTITAASTTALPPWKK